MDNTYVLIAFGVVAFGALLYLIYRQFSSSEEEVTSIQEEFEAEMPVESDSYYEDSEVYSD